ncbi:MAG: SDR family NAD(P)-dependent oxidoreductase [Actinobacteria bacterium]|nr:MAG: SDR family NAD(P)-dependent oxidoreductase [Actinomycetota bacterium]
MRPHRGSAHNGETSPARQSAGRSTLFITGAARGIGAATAERLHARGDNVALVGLEPERLEALAARLGDRAAFFEADVTDRAALDAAVAGAVERFGGIDVAIANAGIHTTGSLLGADPDRIEHTLEVNLFGVLRTDLAVLPQIVQRKGYLLNVASLAAASHAPLTGPYTASKAGVEALTDTLRVELSTTGARAGCAYFGFIDTDLVRASFAQSSTQTLQGNMPAFIRTPVPVGKAVDAIERAVDKRLARTWAPRFVGGFLALRGILQPLAEKRLMGSPELAAAIAEADAAGRSEGDLGVAGQLVS